MRILVVGAGPAGLTYAKGLKERGAEDASVNGSILSGQRAALEVLGV